VDIDPLAGKTDAGQEGLHNGTGDTQQGNGPQAHGHDEKGLVMIGLFHEASPEYSNMKWGQN
jgi:hypothetical protein